MDHIRILKRAFSITRSYRALWVFGILLGLTAGGRAGANAGGGGGGNGGGGDGSGGVPGPFPPPQISPEVINALIIAGVTLLCIILLLSVITVIVRYVAETALIRMVDQHEATGVKVGVRQGFRLGWSRAALRLFLLDLVIGLGVALVFLLLLAVAASPLLVWFTANDAARVLGTVAAVALIIVVIFALVITAIALSLLSQFWHRAVVLEGHGVRDALRRGWQLLRQRLGDGVIMGLILFGLGLAWALVLVPVVFLLLALAALGGGLPALLAFAVTSLITQSQGAAPWIVAAVVGLPIFIVIMALPLLFLGGLAQTFQSSTWTLTYRELLALEAAGQANGDAPPPGGDDLPAPGDEDLPPAPMPAA
jgi:hypothetical protein